MQDEGDDLSSYQPPESTSAYIFRMITSIPSQLTVVNVMIILGVITVVSVSTTLGVELSKPVQQADTVSSRPTAYPTPSPTHPTAYPTPAPSAPTPFPSPFPSRMPSFKPSKSPTQPPTLHPSGPSYSPTPAPTEPALCCDTTPYFNYPWWTCETAANMYSITSCSTCAAFQCIDWTMGSAAMTDREAAFLARTGENVLFAVGAYGYVAERAGLCYRMTVQGVSQDVIGQVINIGGEIVDASFQAQIADGGFGAVSACVADFTYVPQYTGTTAQWNYLGAENSSQCLLLPDKPMCIPKKEDPPDSLKDMCLWTFATGLKKENQGYHNIWRPFIEKMCPVACPSELWMATGLHRADEPNTAYTCGPDVIVYTPDTTGSFMPAMDCAKPAYAWTGNIPRNVKWEKYRDLVVPCRRNGYDRINT